MKIKSVIILLLVLIGHSCKTAVKKTNTNRKIKIEWTENLEGDFSFKENWSYKESIYKNSHGQLSCDGDCPPEIDQMKDESGKIYKDSLQAFYTIIDTTHINHSLQSENKMYEYSGTDFIEFQKVENEIIKGKSANNVSTNSSLIIEIKNDFCSVWVDFNSIRDLGQNIFPLENGTIKIDRKLFKKGTLKAVFDFKFKNTLEPKKALFWKGKVYSEIKNKT
ncbi:hypothetical protein H0I23_11070 [Cellulophaga sp. HaHaR_3_176]|uniref:hypothetical protein n=1 Tax=Cellulophaga sp. HaHaR_3_176 TaxID=1942464 RepID=UPI001C1F5C03|nr:hypothetical protein [Cellulophaga sp. HaHaR_3_176]QWX83001.1 hypothetical protein H0I23_11070 [Cellulophaga sp. HaHaR_3_176]